MLKAKATRNAKKSIGLISKRKTTSHVQHTFFSLVPTKGLFTWRWGTLGR